MLHLLSSSMHHQPPNDSILAEYDAFESIAAFKDALIAAECHTIMVCSVVTLQGIEFIFFFFVILRAKYCETTRPQ